MSSLTSALLRKDRGLLLAALVGVPLAGAVFFQAGLDSAFVIPDKSFAEELELALVAFAVLLGLATSVETTLRQTQDFLRHRPVTPGRLFWTRHLAIVATIFLWTGLGMLGAWIPDVWSGANGACVDPERFGVLAALSAGFALDYAVVVLGLALPMRWIVRFLAAALLLFLRYAAQSALAFLDPSWGACFLAYALGGALALWLAARCEAVGHDPDRPTPARALVGAGALATLAAACFGTIAATGWHELALDGLVRSRPMVARLGEDEVGLLGRRGGDELYPVLDERGQPTGRRVPLQGTDHRGAPQPRSAGFDALRVPALHPPFAWYQSRAGAPITRRVWAHEDALRIVEFLPDDRRRCWTLPLPEGTTRSRDAGFLEFESAGGGVQVLVGNGPRSERQLFYFAPERGELWLVAEEAPPRLEPQTPGSERPVRLTHWRDPSGEWQSALATTTQVWAFEDGSWRALGPPQEPRSTHTVLDDDPLRPEVELRLASGAVLRHRYELASFREWLCAGFAVLASVVRPLPFAVLGAATDYAAVAEAQPDEALLPLDPLLGGGYAWLLVPNLALNVLLVVLVRRELRRRGLPGRRIAAWSLAVLVAGAFAGPVLLALEPKRAWRRPARSVPPPPLIAAA